MDKDQKQQRIRQKNQKGMKKMRLNIILECVETGERLYLTSKNKRNNPERLEMKKYSQKLRRRAIFREVK